MKTLRSFVGGRWIEGREPFATLVNPATEDQLGRTARYAGLHLWVPRDGVAVHINAFNFPAWGTCEKAACALLAGMPILSKPATSTALAAWRAAEIGAGILPGGAFQFICGSPGDLLDRLGPQDVVAFTGSSQTAAKLRE